MVEYNAPQQDMQFVLHELLQVERHYQSCGYHDVDSSIISAILEEAAKFTENFLAPIRQLCDKEGAKFSDGEVQLPPAIKEAYQQYCAGAWGAMSCNPEFGGQGLPHSLALIFHEMICSANVGFVGLATLAQGAILALEAHANETIKKQFLPKLISGQWAATMCLTEPHCGSDVGLVRTRATPSNDEGKNGSYIINGSKIFISYGQHDLTENIIHLVLARLPNAPKGPKGISLFVVPKILIDKNGQTTVKNNVTATNIEEKMGLKLSPTCAMSFDNATGWLVGGEHQGLASMFTMMNSARLDVGIEGLAAAQLAYQGSLEYAQERLQMRAASGAVAPEKDADPLIAHADIRRMLLTQKAFTEGCRALAYFVAQQLDASRHHHDTAAKKNAEDLLAFLTPINKSFLTERGVECANLGIQIYGGHGYIRESGMEQILRDIRIAPIYEGTNTIQANDLIRRKVLGSNKKLLNGFIELMDDFIEQEPSSYATPFLIHYRKLWLELTDQLLNTGTENPEVLAASAVDYQEFSGYVVLAYFWARMETLATKQLIDKPSNAFYLSKQQTAQFYFERLLPRAKAHAEIALASVNPVMMDVELFL